MKKSDKVAIETTNKFNEVWTKIKKGFNDYVLPFMGKIGNQRHLSAIRDSFGTMIPLIIAGGFGLLINAIIFGGAGSGKVSLLGLFAKAAGYSWDQIGPLFSDPTLSTGWAKASQIGGLAFGHISTATIGMMSIYFAFLLGYFLSISRNYKHPVMAGFVSLASFIIASMGQITFFMDAKGIFAALIVGIISTEFLCWLGSIKKLEVRLPQGVPPAVGKSFASLIPVILTLGMVGALNIIVLAPAIAQPGWHLYIENYTAMVSNKNIWNTDIASKLSIMNFADYLYSHYNLEIFAKNSDGTWNIAVEGKDWAAVFGTNNITDVTNAMANFGVGNEVQMTDWFNGLKGLMTGNGYNSLGQYLLALNGQDIAGNTGFNDLITNFYFSTVDGHALLTISVRYGTIPVGSTSFGISAAIYKFFISWFIGFATGNGGLGLAIAYVFFISFFWFFGVHGANIMGAIFEPIWWMIMGLNTALISAGLSARTNLNDQVGIFGKPFFDIYMSIGGSGATLGLLIMVLIISRRKELKEVAKYSLPAGCFNINEPVIFGFPLVLNTTYVIPFILSPLVATLIGWLATGPLHIVNVVYITIPWTTPWLLGSILATVDPMAILVAIICFAVATAIWLPFIFLDNKIYFRKLKLADPVKYEEEMKYIHDKDYRNKVKEQAKKEKLAAKQQLKLAKQKEKENKSK